ncbi:MAG: hypothetical protein QF351_03450 [Phycisphaerales bacterium]|nr:hypothetical protein [Phycisphaerales bacterium]MDP7400944.1 hypothetical protein [Phycisphaerales bacterium]
MQVSQSLQISAGTRVRVTQQLPRGAETAWSTTTEGVVLRARQAETGSWFAHSRNDRLWLDRLEIQKDDGEITTLNLDQFSVVQTLENAG